MIDRHKLILSKRFVCSYTFLAWLVLLGMLLTAFIFMIPNVYRMAYLSGVILILLCSFPFLYSILITKDYFEIINFFTAWFAMSMGIKGLISLQHGSAWLTNYSVQAVYYQKTFLLVFLYSILGLLCLYVGYYIGIGKKLALALPVIKSKGLHLRKRMKLLMLIFVVIASAGLYIFYINEIRGLFPDGESYATSKILKLGIKEGGRLYYSLFINFASIGLILLYSSCIKRKFGLIEIATGFIFLLLILIFFLFIGTKGIILYPALSLIVAYHYIHKRLSCCRIAFCSLLLILLMPIIQAYRISRFSLNAITEQLKFGFNSFFELIVNRSAGADMFFLILDKTPHTNSFLYGKTISKILTSFIPRRLWSGKPWSFGRDFGQSYVDIDVSTSCVSPSTIGEWYINFGVVGIVIGFFLFGVILRTIYVYCIEKGITRINVAIYAIIFPVVINLVDGPITEYVVFTAMALFPIFIFLFLDKFLFGYEK